MKFSNVGLTVAVWVTATLGMFACSHKNETDDGSDSDAYPDVDTDPEPGEGRHVFLVPMPEDEVSPQDFAFLAAVAASQKSNEATHASVIAVPEDGSITEEVEDYLKRYNPTGVYAIGEVADPGFTVESFPSGSAREVGQTLADRFWDGANNVVLADVDDYPNALVASALAARLGIPLLFFDTDDGLLPDTQTWIEDMGAESIVVAGDAAAVTDQLGDIVELPDAKSVLHWMRVQGMEVDYFAYANARDRVKDDLVVNKASLAAPLLAAAHQGTVVPFGFDTKYQNQLSFDKTEQTGTQPPGAYQPTGGTTWALGTIRLGGESIPFANAHFTDRWDTKAQRANLDFNNNGNFGDAGEGPFTTGDIVTIANKDYQIVVGPEDPEPMRSVKGNLKLIYPTAPDIQEELGAYYDLLGEHPEHICLVGLWDTIPFHVIDYPTSSEEDCIASDYHYAEAGDGDTFPDIAVGRVIGYNLSYTTLLAARSVTYADLVDDEWSRNINLQGIFFEVIPAAAYMERVGIDNVVGRAQTTDKNEILTNMAKSSMISHSWHCDHGGLGFGPQTPWMGDVLLPPLVMDSTGCLTAGTDLAAFDGNDGYGWERIYVPQHLRRGAIAYLGSNRTCAGQSFTQRHEYYHGLVRGDTVGQAFRRGQQALHYTSNHHGLFTEYPAYFKSILYGDPAVHIHLPNGPIDAPANTVTQDGDVLTATLPTLTHLTEYNAEDHLRHYYFGLGLFREYNEFGNMLARFNTSEEAVGLEQIGNVPGDLGWPERNAWMVDHQRDGTHTLIWRVRFIDHESEDESIDSRIDAVSYRLLY